jgi:hypothetical protein
MYEEYRRGFNLVGLAINRDIEVLFRQKIVIGHTNLPFRKICINVPRPTPQAIFNSRNPLLHPPLAHCYGREPACDPNPVALIGYQQALIGQLDNKLPLLSCLQTETPTHPPATVVMLLTGSLAGSAR